MKTVKTSLSFKLLSPALLVVFAPTILACFTGNVNFPNPYPVLNLLQTAITNLSNAIAAQHPGDKASTSAVKDAKRQLNRVLKALAGYVEFETDTDETKALTSGFNLSKARGAMVSAFIVVQGEQSGSVDASSPGGGNSYLFWHNSFKNPYSPLPNAMVFDSERKKPWVTFTIGVLQSVPEFYTISKFDSAADVPRQMILGLGVGDLEKKGIHISFEDYHNYLKTFKGTLLIFGEPMDREGLYIWYKPAKCFITYYHA